MYSETNKPKGHTAAWRISIWSTLAFAVGSVILFLFLQRFASHEIQNRTDAWLSGEVETLGDVAERTPKDSLHDRIVDEVAELATKEVPLELQAGGNDPNQAVFFIETDSDNRLKLWAGKGDSKPYLTAISRTIITPGKPADVFITGFFHPFRVVCLLTPEGDRIHLGLSEAHDIHILRRMRLRLLSICLGMVVLGFCIVFFATKRMLDRVHRITRTANRIGQHDLRSRVPEVRGTDEIAQLARTLNRMLDRIENSVNQLHTITNSLAHDLRSPMMAVRGKLELALLADHESAWTDPIASALEELDRLSDFLTKSLDVAEANADALRLRPVSINLDELLRTMVDLYEPSLTERGLKVSLHSGDSLMVSADPALLHRMLANLLDNAIKHLPAGTTIHFQLQQAGEFGRLEIEDDGPGFPAEVVDRPFEKNVKGNNSTGSGLGLAFAEAVVRAHGGQIRAYNGGRGGACIIVDLPLATRIPAEEPSLEQTQTS
ncbi:MAG TPA: ATP-binding protein [Terracidiphilus sp.]|jgi:signal transduction histidine kinase